MQRSYIQNINGKRFLVIQSTDKHGRKTRTMRKLPKLETLFARVDAIMSKDIYK